MNDRPLCHLIISREFPPASYAPGGIGTYAEHIAGILADAGETVHVIGERWSGAPEPREERCGGRLVVHRVALEPDLPGLGGSPAQRFARQAARLAETLVEQEQIDLIEAQEWEAPFYYLMLRRALGLGPQRRPPCIVHLHSPTEFIYRHNQWTGRPEYLPAARLEEFCIRSADAWFCPSHYLARQVAERYRIPVDSIAVIPYPQGDSAFVAREPGVWRDGSVLYVGRLEPRKGIIEFVEAAVEVARQDLRVAFDFVGDDVRYPRFLTVRRYLHSRIPRALRARFRFHGVQPRSRLAERWGAARVAVVPSRWENFPNTCIEAMSSGLPVLASPTGGMTEMLEDGVTGWIAESQSPHDLAVALRRALAASPDQRAAMGRAATESIRGLCGNEITARRHLARRREVAARGEGGRNPVFETPGLGCPGIRRQGIAIVVQAEPDSGSSRAIDSIARLNIRPKSVAALEARDATAVSALSRAVLSLIEDHAVTAVALVPASVALEPTFLEACDGALARFPRLGILSFAHPPPAFPWQWVADGVGDAALVRSDAWLEAGGLREHLPLRYARWDLWNAIMVGGWTALAFPETVAVRDDSPMPRHDTGHDAALVRELRERFATEFARDAELVRSLELIPDADSEPHLRDVFRLPLREQVGLVIQAVREPRRALGWLKERWSRQA